MNNQQQDYQPQPQFQFQPQQQPPLPMKWFKFLIYFSLFFSCLVNVVTGINYLTGNIYISQGVTANLVYAIFPSMKGFDLFNGIACFALGVFAIITRFALAKYKKSGPMFLYSLYVANAVVALIYGIGATVALGEVAFNPISIGGTVLMIVLNVVYFNKRKHLFVN